MLRILLLIIFSVSCYSSFAQKKAIGKQEAVRMINTKSWQYDTWYSITLKRNVDTLPSLWEDRSYLKKVLERNGWKYTDWSSGNYPEGPRFTEMIFKKGKTECTLHRIYKSAAKAEDGYYRATLLEEIVFSKKQ